jgi:hypothetical protein
MRKPGRNFPACENENLRRHIKAGVEALQRGEFMEIADANLERYVNDLVSPRKKRSLSAKPDTDDK